MLCTAAALGVAPVSGISGHRSISGAGGARAYCSRPSLGY